MTTTTTAPVDVVRAVYEAFGRGDLPGVLAHLAPDVEIRQSEALPWGGTWHGHEGAVQFFATLTAHIETRIEADRFVVAADAVVENGRTVGRAVATGREFAIDETHVWQVRDGRVTALHAVVDDAAMLEALGLG